MLFPIMSKAKVVHVLKRSNLSFERDAAKRGAPQLYVGQQDEHAG
jgi:hypothetical protein